MVAGKASRGVAWCVPGDGCVGDLGETDGPFTKRDRRFGGGARRESGL